MKVEVLKENLKYGLSVVDRIVGKNLSLPILNDVLIDAQDNFLGLVSTDLETAIKIWVLAKIVKGGKFVVPAKFVSGFISLLPNDKILIEAKDQGLHVECGKLKTKIQGHNPDDFPIIPEIGSQESIEVSVENFYQGLSQVVDFCSNSQTRPEISGVYFSFSKNILKMAATDSFRLAEKNIIMSSAVKKDLSFIIPQRAAREIINILDGKEGLLKIYFSQNQILFELGMKEIKHPQVQLTSRLIEGEYPNYQEIIPNKFKTKATISKEGFLNQIKAAALFSGKVNEVRVSFSPEKKEVEVFSQSPDVGESRSTSSAKIEGDLIEVAFNYKFLIDGLVNIKSSEVMFEISKEDGACILRPVGENSYIYVVMPIKSM